MPEEEKENLSERKRVLIVDDLESDAEHVSEILQKGGLEPVLPEDWGAVSVRAAIESQSLIDLIISDGLNGDWEKISNIARRAGIPFLLVSRDGGYLEKAKEMGNKVINRAALENVGGREWSFSDWLKEEFFAEKTD